MKGLKVIVKDVNEFNTIQEKVFENGGSWYSGKKEVLDCIEDANYEDKGFVPYGMSIEFDDSLPRDYEHLNMTYYESDFLFNRDETCESISFEEFMGIDNLKKYLKS